MKSKQESEVHSLLSPQSADVLSWGGSTLEVKSQSCLTIACYLGYRRERVQSLGGTTLEGVLPWKW